MTKKRILIVDDDRAHLETTRELLEDEGYEVFLQAGPFGATERIMVIRPDVVLLDVNMPALSGEALLPILKAREQTRDTKVVLFSSNDEEQLRAAAKRLGAAGWACKGDLAGLRRVLDRLLAGPPVPRWAAPPPRDA
jgi:CheY-like chemotaxis protein